jgi:uncharacterized membrane protein
MNKIKRWFNKTENTFSYKAYLPKTAHGLFLLIAIPVLVTIIIANPPMHGSDENSHLIRAYQLSRGIYYPEPHNRDTLPLEFEQFIEKNFPGSEHRYPFGKGGMAIVTEKSKEVPKAWTDVNTMGYPPVVYLPAAIGFRLASMLYVPIGFSVWIAKIFQASMYVGFIYIALRFAKDASFRWVIFVVALLPMSLYSASTINGDAYTNSVTLLFLSIVFTFMLDKNRSKIDQRHLILFVSSAILLSFTKTVYLIFLPLIFFVPGTIFLSQQKKALSLKILLLVVCLLIGGAIYRVGLTAKYNPFLLMPAYANASAVKQVQYMEKRPAYAITTFTEDTINNFGNRLSSMINGFGEMFRLKNHIDTSFFATFFGISAIIAASTNSEKLKTRSKIIAVGLIVCLLYSGIVLAMWLGNNIGTTSIQGVQGRYFIPLILPLAVLLPKIKYLKGNLEKLIILLILLTISLYMFEYLDKIITTCVYAYQHHLLGVKQL